MSAPHFIAIVLCAGWSRRMGGPNKLLESWRGRPVAAHAIAAACESCAERVVLVTGRDGDAVAALASHPKIVRAHLASPGEGLSESLRLGVSMARTADAAAVLLGDMPKIDGGFVDELFQHWRAGIYALVPVRDGRRGNPVLLGPEAMGDASKLRGDSGARAMLERAGARVVEMQAADDAVLFDIDTPRDLRA